MTREIKHHLTDALLMGYAAGNLSEAFSLVVATHISMCDECRARQASFDAIGGEVMCYEVPVAMSEGSLAATMAKCLQDEGASATNYGAAKYHAGVFPKPLQDYVAGDLDAVKWRKVGGGVSQMVLSVSDAATVRLLKIPAGASVPDHGHRGIELTLVLQGAFVDETDRFGTGDIEVADEVLNHTPVAEEGLDCICLAATDAPLRFNRLIPRIAQKFIGI